MAYMFPAFLADVGATARSFLAGPATFTAKGRADLDEMIRLPKGTKSPLSKVG